MKRVCQRVSRATVIMAAALGACAPPAQRLSPAPDRGALVLRLGPDTMLVERFELSPGRLYVESALRAPRAAFRTIDARLNPDGSLASMTVATFDPANPRGSSATDSATVALSADSTIYSLGIGANKSFIRLPGRADVLLSVPGTFWFPNYALVAATRAPRAVGDSIVGIMSMRLGAYPLLIERVAPDTLRLRSQIAGTVRLIVRPDGKLAGFDGTGSSMGYIGTRVDWIDIDSVSRAFAAKERATGAVGILSARDTAEAYIAGARLLVDYGRPSKRGRRIFGNVVAWNAVWRTGANLATHFSTSRALQFGTTVLPAGTYTLHTIPTPESWTLLVSSQTGQWGTSALDPAMIVARIPMRVERRDTIVETLTIGFRETAAGGVLRLEWDDTVAEADFVVR